MFQDFPPFLNGFVVSEMKLFTLVALPVVSAEKWGWTTAATENVRNILHPIAFDCSTAQLEEIALDRIRVIEHWIK